MFLRLAKWKDDYVPGDFLCHGDNGYGDYIIFKVGADGFIEGWESPEIKTEQWDVIEQLQGEETVTISKKIYDNLIESDNELSALHAHGVDNWVGYDDAMESIEE